MEKLKTNFIGKMFLTNEKKTLIMDAVSTNTHLLFPNL